MQHANNEPDFSNFKIHDEFKEHLKVVNEINDYASARALLSSSMAEEIDKHNKKRTACFWAGLVLTGGFCWMTVLPWYAYVFGFVGVVFVLISTFASPSKIPVPVVGLYKREFYTFCDAPDGGWIKIFAFHVCYKQCDGYKTITKYKYGVKTLTFVSFGTDPSEILISIE